MHGRGPRIDRKGTCTGVLCTGLFCKTPSHVVFGLTIRASGLTIQQHEHYVKDTLSQLVPLPLTVQTTGLIMPVTGLC
jgi:hypothetical protein